MYFIYLLFYGVCLYFAVRNLLSKNKYGLTFADGSIQHFTYKQWEKINKIMNIVTKPFSLFKLICA
jgi:predicted Kef-type K+ transport protein